MKKTVFILASLILLACGKETKQEKNLEKEPKEKVEAIDTKAFEASLKLSETEAEVLKIKMIRSIGKLPKKANHFTKYEEKFDEYYQELASNHELLFYHKSETNDTTYFAITRRAPSLYDKHVSIGGKFVAKDSTFAYFEESFRSFKMLKEDLHSKTAMLFQDLIEGKNLAPYYFANSHPEEIIEFPDEFTTYDPEKLMWVSQREIY